MLPVSSDLLSLFQNGGIFQFASKLQVLDHNYKAVGEFTNNIMDGRITVDNSRASVRSFDVRATNVDGALTWGSDKLIWLDKYFKPYIGVMVNKQVTTSAGRADSSTSEFSQGTLTDLEVV